MASPGRSAQKEIRGYLAFPITYPGSLRSPDHSGDPGPRVAGQCSSIASLGAGRWGRQSIRPGPWAGCSRRHEGWVPWCCEEKGPPGTPVRSQSIGKGPNLPSVFN